MHDQINVIERDYYLAFFLYLYPRPFSPDASFSNTFLRLDSMFTVQCALKLQLLHIAIHSLITTIRPLDHYITKIFIPFLKTNITVIAERLVLTKTISK